MWQLPKATAHFELWSLFYILLLSSFFLFLKELFYYVFLAVLCGIWDLNSPTRDWTSSSILTTDLPGNSLSSTWLLWFSYRSGYLSLWLADCRPQSPAFSFLLLSQPRFIHLVLTHICLWLGQEGSSGLGCCGCRLHQAALKPVD